MKNMDSKSRLIVKALTWQFSGLLTMTVIGYLISGSFNMGSSIAFLGAIAGFFAYFVHESLWARIRWGQND
ncbi:DUF2061 domain-containing protein [Alphaproteobacteria bacterium]|nr:DUF2061 domain-containing protein [Alphaproteobacteria bacterium]